MSWNHSAIVDALGEALDQPVSQRTKRPRQRVSSASCLPERLPSTAFIEREAEGLAPDAIFRQLRRSPTPPHTPEQRGSTKDEEDVAESPISPASKPSRSLSWKRGAAVSQGPWKEPQTFEIFRAIERKDTMYLMEIRDKAFHLLLRKSGDATPLLHAMRIGDSHREVQIVLLGAFSRWVNCLDEDEIKNPQTRVLLKALRTNLKLAIDYGLAKYESTLTASFLQTLVMSEGDKWVWSQVANVSLALRAGTAGEPVKTAESAVRRFTTKELGKAELIAAVEDYISNATIDLLIMASWSLASEAIQIPSNQISAASFARDDRVFKALQDRLNAHKAEIREKCSRRLKWQFRVIQAVMDSRSTTLRRRVEQLMQQLDSGPGV